MPAAMAAPERFCGLARELGPVDYKPPAPSSLFPKGLLWLRSPRGRVYAGPAALPEKAHGQCGETRQALRLGRICIVHTPRLEYAPERIYSV